MTTKHFIIRTYLFLFGHRIELKYMANLHHSKGRLDRLRIDLFDLL